MTCFHCHGAGFCSCLFCDGDKCIACAGRKRMAGELELADRLRLDVRDSASYELKHTGLHFYRALRLPPGVQV